MSIVIALLSVAKHSSSQGLVEDSTRAGAFGVVFAGQLSRVSEPQTSVVVGRTFRFETGGSLVLSASDENLPIVCLCCQEGTRAYRVKISLSKKT